MVNAKRYPADFNNYYEREFRWGRFLVESSPEQASRRESYKEILEICNARGWQPYDPGDEIWKPADKD